MNKIMQLFNWATEPVTSYGGKNGAYEHTEWQVQPSMGCVTPILTPQNSARYKAHANKKEDEDKENE